MIDLILLVIVLLALLWGWFRGGVRVLAGLGALIVAFQVARYYSVFWAAPVVSILPEPSGQGGLMDLLTMFVDADVVALRIVQVVLFIIIFILTRWLINKLAALFTGLLGSSILAVINRVFGALLCGMIISILIMLIHRDLLTLIGNMGFDLAFSAQEYLERSQFVLPLIYLVPRLFGL